MIESERLILRGLEERDAQDMYEYTGNEVTSKYLTWEPHISQEQAALFIKKAIADKETIYYGIESKDENKLIGCVHIYEISKKHKRAEISYIINPKYCGKGYGTEAVKCVINCLFKKDFNRIQALCVIQNVKSEELMKRCGMVYEGTLRKYAILKDGNLYDMKIYSICREEV